MIIKFMMKVVDKDAAICYLYFLDLSQTNQIQLNLILCLSADLVALELDGFESCFFVRVEPTVFQYTFRTSFT